MIRNEAEYGEAVRRLKAEEQRYDEHRERLRAKGLSDEEIARVVEPLISFHLQLQEEVESYERLKRGELGELQNLHGLGKVLVGLRIACGISQRELAKRLKSSESQVSRDERNEYNGITVERAARILDAMGVRLKSTFDEPVCTAVAEDTAEHMSA